jgi:hypothetical protein
MDGTAPGREGLANETAEPHVILESPPEDLK